MSTLAPQRSTTGCWTCRLRRKKCAEGGLPCRTCQDRNLFCHGYGPKPDWKDRGHKEKEQLKKVLEQCARKRRSRKKSDATTRRNSAILEPLDLAAVNCTTPPSADFPCSTNPSDMSVNVQTPIPDPSFWVSENDPVGIRHFDDIIVQGYLESNQFLPGGDIDYICGPLEPQALQGQDLFQLDMSAQEVPWEMPACLARGATIVTDAEAEAHADLTMSYICDTFPSQFPSYAAAARKGWLLILLKSFSRICTVSFALSTYSQWLANHLSNDQNISRKIFEDYKFHRNQAVNDWRRRSRDPIAEADTLADFEDFVCSMQFANLESATGNVQNFRQHFDTACQCFARCYETILASRPAQKHAIEIFGSQLIAADVLMSTFAPLERSLPSFHRYRELLVGGKMDLLSNLGYANWTLIAILDILELEQWKLEEEGNSNLSVRELVKRAEMIEMTLEKGLEDMEMDSQILVPSGNSAKSQREERNKLATAVFATSALVYVNKVVSGARPYVPEVKTAVARVVKVWEALPASCDLHLLKWSYCVTACLAIGSQRDIFRDFGSLASFEQQTFCNLSQMKSVVEDCWKRFDAESADADSSCDWRTSAERLGVQIFFG